MFGLRHRGRTRTQARFFGAAARPIAEIEMRRHPLSFAAYGMVAIIGFIFVFHIYGIHTQGELFPGVSPWAIFVWKWMMVVGGLGCVSVLIVNPRPRPNWPDLADLLHMETILAGVSACGMSIYLVVTVNVNGLGQSAPALGVYGLLILGHIWRGWQAAADAKTLEDLARSQEAQNAALDD